MTDLKRALKIVAKTNKLLARLFQPLGTNNLRIKNESEIVTNVDIVSNDFVTKQLLKYFPNDDIISEEAARIDSPGKAVWYIDPLDGTTNFSYGLREFGVCLARISEGKTDIGIIGLPLAKEIYWTENGKAFLNGKAISVAAKARSNRSLVFVCDGHSSESKEKFIKILERIDSDKTRIRGFSAASVELTAVASGRADGCILPETKPWDALAGVALIRAAGGKVTNFAGANWTINDSTLIASSGAIHEELLALTK